MSVALCNPDAFYPLRTLVDGPLTDPADLPKIERFVRSLVLHDEMKMIMEPSPDMDEEHEWMPEEIAAGGRIVLVGVGPAIAEYEGRNLLEYLPEDETPRNIDISNELLQLAETHARRGDGPCFDAHLNVIRVLVHTVETGGSIVCENSFADDVITVASEIPENLLTQLDAEWAEMVRSISNGDIGLVVPPFLAILLNRCARRDAILDVLQDMKNEFSASRERLWSLIRALRGAGTIAEANEIRRDLQRAAELMNPNREWPPLCPVRALWKIGTAAVAGAVVGAMGGSPFVGAAAAVVNQAANVIGNVVLEFRVLFRRGAFDLARRLNRDLREIPRMPELLRPILTQEEQSKLGLA